MAESGESGESDAEARDSGASIMSRGGKHGDTAALGKMMGLVQGWMDKPHTAAQIESEDEGGEGGTKRGRTHSLDDGATQHATQQGPILVPLTLLEIGMREKDVV